MKFKRILLSGLILCCCVSSAVCSASDTPQTVTAVLRPLTLEYRAYGQVEPRSLVTVRAATIGTVRSFNVLPGDRLRAGQRVARLAGPDYAAAMAAAHGRRDAAQSTLAAVQHNYPQFSSIQDVANANAALADAQAALTRLLAAGQIRAPVSGTVLAVTAARGERVTAGESLLTIEPTNRLWIRAVYYGSHAAPVQVGMQGEFVPADGARPVPVKVVTVFAARTRDGGESIGLFAANPAQRLFNGEFGTLTLNGAAQRQVVVPSRALVLDRGRWWVLVGTPHGFRPQEVTPGPTRGWDTFIEQGLAPGEHVLVENAYLEFHRSIAQSYQPPD